MASATGHASLIGAQLGGYEVQALIGRGAMGTVYLAHDEALKRKVALKVLLGSVAHNPRMVRQFQLEAKAAAPLNHPGIVRIYNAGQERGTPYIAMEYVEGEPLDRFLRRKGLLPWQNALYIAQQVADALACAHSHGVIHRDVKPANIMLDRKGRVRLTDFGIASVQDEGASGPQFFTPQYMSPEQCSGGRITASTDLFSLGVILYQMLAGRLPFEGDSPAALIKSISNDDPQRLNRAAGLPDDVSRLADFMLQKTPNDRPADAQAVSSLIARIQQQKGGVSAVPQALDAFIREEAQPREVKGYTPAKKASKKQLKKAASKPKRSSLAAPALWLLSMILIAIASIAGVPMAYSHFAEESILERAVLEYTAFETFDEGVILAQLQTEGLEFGALAWAGDEQGLVAEVRGTPDSLMAGASGTVALDVKARCFLSLRTPSGPGIDTQLEAVAASALPTQSIPPRPGNDAMQANLLSAEMTPNRDVLLRPQRWDEAVPRRSVLFRTSLDQWLPSSSDPSKVPYATLAPDGFSLCVVVNNPIDGTNHLAQRDIRWKEPGRLGDPITQRGLDILPRSVRYLPDSSRVAYIQQTAPGERALLMAPEGIHSGLCTVGDLGDTLSIDPLGLFITFTKKRPSKSEPELTLWDIKAERITASLGTGHLGPEAWHPSDRYIVVASRRAGIDPNSDDASLRAQMWAVETVAPYRRIQLTNFEEGIKGGCAVSHDGAWAAAALDQTSRPTLVIVDINHIRFDNLDAHDKSLAAPKNTYNPLQLLTLDEISP